MKRTWVFYAVTLLAAAGAVAWILDFGQTLPVPGAAGNAAVPPAGGVPAHGPDPLARFFAQLLTILATSRLVGWLFTRAGQPRVVGEMASGIVLGPSLLGWVAPELFQALFPPHSLGPLRLLSQLGVCLFMFAVGMELDVRHLRRRTHAAVVVSHASIVLPYLLGVGLALLLFTRLAAPGASFTGFALFMGISMSITAFPVLARILQERGLSRTTLGSLALTCAAVDDVTAWTLLALVVAIAGSADLATTGMRLLLVVVFLAAMLKVVQPALPRLVRATDAGSGEVSGNTLAILLLVLLASAWATEAIGIHALFGAFLAGVVVPEAHGLRERLSVRLEHLSSVLLLPIFFVFTGLRTEIGLLGTWQDAGICLGIILVATLGKLGGSALAARFVGLGWPEALQLGALMNTRGLMELIALNLGYDLGLLSPRIFSMLVLMALVTTAMTGPLLTWFGRIRPADRLALAGGVT